MVNKKKIGNPGCVSPRSHKKQFISAKERNVKEIMVLTSVNKNPFPSNRC
jgi:hypothetical protein